MSVVTEQMLAERKAEKRAMNLYGWAGLLRGVAIGLGFVGVLGLAIDGDNLLVFLILAGLAVACLVGARDLDKSADSIE